MNREKLKLDIINVLRQYPNGLKARDIASKITNADKSSVNSILYANTDTFCSNDYVWNLVPTKTPNKIAPSFKKTSIPQPISKPKKVGNTLNNSISLPNLHTLNIARANDERIRLYLDNPNLSLNMSLSQMQESLSKPRNDTYNKCTGDCSLCKREKCINDN